MSKNTAAAKPPKVEVYGVRGMKSRPFRRVFTSQAAFEKWLGENAADVEIYGTREIEE